MPAEHTSPAPVVADLSPPPRRVPLTVQIVCLFGGTKGCLWFWVFFGMLGVWAFAEPLVEREMVAYSIFGLAVFGLVSALGIMVTGASVREGLRDRGLLIHGRFAVGRQVGEKRLQAQCSRLTLEVVEAEGGTLEVRATAYLDHFVEPPAERRLLYDPAAPDYALLLDNGGASSPPELDGRGGFRRPGAGDVAAALAFPLLVLIVPVRGLVMLLIQGLF